MLSTCRTPPLPTRRPTKPHADAHPTARCAASDSGPVCGIRPPYQPFGAARELMRCRDREVLISGPAGTGKSLAALIKIDLAASQTPIRAAMIRKLRTGLTQAAMVTFNEKVLPPPPRRDLVSP